MVENLRTLAEIKSTVHENIIPIGSISRDIKIGVELTLSKFHSRRMLS